MKVMNKALPIMKDIIKDMFLNQTPFEMIETFRFADLGCASGPNTLLFVSEIIDTVYKLSNQINNKIPEILVVLNDLHKNDFNNIFIVLPSFYEQLKEKYGYEFSQKCLFSGVPASFYERIFPRKSLHFVHSSYSIHWISQVPENLDNKGHIYMEKTCHPNVFNVYKKQFYKDFSSFLTHRSHEILPKGRMVLTLIGRNMLDHDPSENDIWCIYELLAQSLLDAVSQGLIKQSEVDSFNLPVYHPYKDEVMTIIEEENSFYLEKLQDFDCEWDPDDKLYKKGSGEYLTNCIRSISEPMLVSHFGELDLDYVFERYKEHAANNLKSNKTNYINLIICLCKK
ncbi:probable jasmonic acid carboxyl methyltransferase 2 [Impatiens glandulifera]|uniref:probable jasmonic acid carboxyl methyltransferase 2 n=1 Tax=Impatiens glandulifera TaxID=253017 RepID=UPI001FB1A11E|nr:probable jasmonic acid carboxyl methyltransferase 2 [Impatiens glandulifera]